MQLALMGSVLIMGFLGSWHCGVMCGPLSCNFRDSRDFASYHCGRLVSYLLLSTLFFSGTHFFMNTDSRGLKLAASIIFGIIFIYFGLVQLNVIKNKLISFKYNKFQLKLLEKNSNAIKKFPLILGLLTGLFPCAWLYSFILFSAQMKSIAECLIVVFIFWLTALPALFAFTGFMKNLIKNSPVRYQTLSGFILILAGLLSLLGHWADKILY